MRAHNCPTVIDVALIQPCDVVSFGSGPQCAWTLDDIPGFLIAFHARAPQIPRSDLPHGGRSRPDTTLLRMNHCQPPGEDATLTLSATPCCGLDGQRSFVARGPVRPGQPEADGLDPTDPTGSTHAGDAGIICAAGWRRNQADRWQKGESLAAKVRSSRPSSPIPSSQAWKGERGQHMPKMMP